MNQVTTQFFLLCKKVGGVIQGQITPTSPEDIAKQTLVSLMAHVMDIISSLISLPQRDVG